MRREIKGGHLYPSDVARLNVPLPSLAEQRRIVDILDRAASIRRLRRQAQETARQIIPALFTKMFGDPATNPMGWPVSRLGDLVRFVSGGTPSKSNANYWGGEIPWVSAKDLKSDPITKSKDTITTKGRISGRLHLIPENIILVLVRGMILMHTIPIKLTAVPVTINQDVKALMPRRSFQALWLHGVLHAMHPLLLSVVSSAAHGTRKIELERLESLSIPVPPQTLQCNFEFRARKFSSMIAKQSEMVELDDKLAKTVANRLLG